MMVYRSGAAVQLEQLPTDLLPQEACNMRCCSTFLVSFFIVLLAMAAELYADDDCYKYSKQEFTTITECDHGCEYVYKSKGRKNHRISGGCASDSSVGCRSRGNGITVCICHGDYCNAQGYEMADDDSSNEN
ncbi:hypothetical protein GCK32_000421 [Trichostrongylus colubriformis]|uniref:Uncharacterized protein n=1 Tax=Trichostrongylus colubriformis TaxID=6319 RepID=A0AAN8FK13_TRICO